MKRSSGIILPLFSLSSPYGVGTMGKAARDFVDFLAEANQSWWQMLPVGPTGAGDSPYQSPSAFAGNPYFIDLDLLVADGLLAQQEIDACDWGGDPGRVDYGLLYQHRLDLLRRACERGWERDRADVQAFAKENEDWLEDYALFMAIKRHFGMSPWYEWPDEAARLHRRDALTRYACELDADVRLFTYVQYLFYQQWAALRAYAHDRGVGIFGDMPIYVALDSADVWAHPENYQLDERNNPVEVAGVPPDYFSADGQLWGNPLYDYQAMAKDGYAWWCRRVQAAGHLYDMVRIDHFRGIARYWSVPAGEKTAKSGHWVWGPGIELIDALKRANPDVRLVAEDLGTPTPYGHARQCALGRVVCGGKLGVLGPRASLHGLERRRGADLGHGAPGSLECRHDVLRATAGLSGAWCRGAHQHAGNHGRQLVLAPARGATHP